MHTFLDHDVASLCVRRPCHRFPLEIGCSPISTSSKGQSRSERDVVGNKTPDYCLFWSSYVTFWINKLSLSIRWVQIRHAQTHVCLWLNFCNLVRQSDQRAQTASLKCARNSDYQRKLHVIFYSVRKPEGVIVVYKLNDLCQHGVLFVPDFGTRGICWPAQGILCLFLIERLQLLTYCSARNSVARQPFCLSTLCNTGSLLSVVKWSILRSYVAAILTGRSHCWRQAKQNAFFRNVATWYQTSRC
jgi:hypothetical protein